MSQYYDNPRGAMATFGPYGAQHPDHHIAIVFVKRSIFDRRISPMIMIKF